MTKARGRETRVRGSTEARISRLSRPATSVYGLSMSSTDSSVTSLQLDADGVVGVVVEPARACGAVLVLGGSEGGTPEPLARDLAAAGLVTLGLAYFGLPGLPSQLVEVPLEYVEQALLLLADHPAAHGRPVNVFGGSKGAELALVMAAQFPDLVGRVVAIAPSSVMWFGLSFENLSAPARSSWRRRGGPLPFVPPVLTAPGFSPAGMALRPIYEACLNAYPADGDAWIALERARGPILLLSGGDDQLWPSQDMAEQLVARMTSHGRAGDIEHVCYPAAGHALLDRSGSGPGEAQSDLPDPRPPALPPLDLGGTPEGQREAARDAWPKILNFLTG